MASAPSPAQLPASAPTDPDPLAAAAASTPEAYLTHDGIVIVDGQPIARVPVTRDGYGWCWYVALGVVGLFIVLGLIAWLRSRKPKSSQPEVADA